MRLWTYGAPPHGKGIAYAELVSVLDEAGCPICCLAARGVSRSLDGLSHESVNDPGVRTELRAARGFCNFHAWQFVEQVRDGLGTAIIYADLLEDAVTRLRMTSTSHTSVRDRLARGWRGRGTGGPARLAGRLAPVAACPACIVLEQRTRAQIDTLLAHGDSDEFRGYYTRSTGLCLPHLGVALRRGAPARVARLLCDQAEQQWRVLNDGQQHQARTGWAAAVALLIGGRGVTPPRAKGVWLAASGGTLKQTGESLPPNAGWLSDCPVCHAGLAAIDRGLLELIAQIPAADSEDEGVTPLLGSICNEHAWQMLERLAPSDALAFLQKRGAEAAGRLSDAYGSARTRHDTPLFRWFSAPGQEADGGRQPGRTCGVCEVRQAAERCAAVLSVRMIASDQSDMPDLCLPHLALVLQSGPPTASGALLTASVRSLSTLRRELRDYIRRQDYHFAGAQLAGLADAPWRAVARVAGARGLMGAVPLRGSRRTSEGRC